MCERWMESRMISLDEIKVAERTRKENGDIGTLAKSIQERGLINPITVMRMAEGGYLLIAGLRRLEAVRSLGETEIMASVASPMEADELLKMEYDENEQRLAFTHTERLAHAAKLKVIVEEQSRMRKGNRTPRKEHKCDERRTYASTEANEAGEGNNEVAKKLRTSDIIAGKVGYGSGRQLERVETIAEKRPDLMEAVDQNKMTVFHAYKIATGKISESEPKKSNNGFIAEEKVEIEPYLGFKPFLEPAPGKVSTLKGADHEHLMENPIYKQLYESYEDAVQQVNLSRSELRSRCEGYERRIRGYKENIQAMEEEIRKLREAQRA